MKKAGAVLAATLAAVSLGAAARQAPPLQAVASLDLARYQGNWFEIARLPNRFQRDCVAGVTAQYLPKPDRTVSVVNRCRKADGSIATAMGVARADASVAAGADATQLAPAQLQVRFAPAWLSWVPFVWGSYWVIVLDPGYRYAVVSEPGRHYLWILARTPSLDDSTYSALLARIAALGFDPSMLIKTLQP
jgi:apolipoprotein D and lipocalin family protein